MQDDLPALCSVTVQAADVPGMAIWTQSASLVGPCSAPVINTDANTALALWAALPSQNSTAVLKSDQSGCIWTQMTGGIASKLRKWWKSYPPSKAIFRLSLKTGFKMYPCSPPCRCWLCQRRSPASTDTHSSWSLQDTTQRFGSDIRKSLPDKSLPNITITDLIFKRIIFVSIVWASK